MNVEVAVDASASGSGGNQGIFYPFDPLRVSSCQFLHTISPLNQKVSSRE